MPSPASHEEEKGQRQEEVRLEIREQEAEGSERGEAGHLVWGWVGERVSSHGLGLQEGLQGLQEGLQEGSRERCSRRSWPPPSDAHQLSSSSERAASPSSRSIGRVVGGGGEGVIREGWEGGQEGGGR